MRVTGACDGSPEGERDRLILSSHTPSNVASIDRHGGSFVQLRSQRRHMLAMLINRFIVQLQTGCGNPDCVTPTCYTCRARVLPNQARVYTTVTARAMAAALATSGKPEMYICPYVTDAQIAQLSADIQDKTDPKSIVQQLFNTKAFRNFQASGKPLRNDHVYKASDGASLLEEDMLLHESSLEPPATQLTCDDMIKARSRHADQRYQRSLASLPMRKDSSLPNDGRALSNELSNMLTSLSNFQTLAASFKDNALEISHQSKSNDIPAVCLDQAFRGWPVTAQTLIFDSLSLALAPLHQTHETVFMRILSDSIGDAAANVANIIIHALTASIPRTQRDTWHVVWSTIVNGRAYGKQRYRKSDAYSSPWLHILDAFEFGPGHGLVDSLINVIAARGYIEDKAAVSPDNRTLQNKKITIRESIINFLLIEEKAVRLTKFGAQQRVESQNGQSLLGTTSLLWLEWLRKCFLKHWSGKYRLQRYSTAATALALMEDIWHHSGISELDLPHDLFPVPVVFNNFIIDKVAVDWLDYQPEPGTRHIVSYQHLFTTRALTLLFRNVNHILMRRAYCAAGAIHKMRTKAMPRSTLRDTTYLDQRLKTAQEPYLVLKINRHSVLSDANDQIWHRTRGELAKPLRVRMGIEEGEIGHDLGGVQIEFFKLACAEALDPNYALFSVDLQTHLAWFQLGSMVPLYKYELFGLLFALAIYNGVTLPVSFPLVFYRKLLGLQHNPSDIYEAWPSQAKSLQAICEYDGSVEDDLARDYTFSFTANGLYVEVDMQNPWRDAEVEGITSRDLERGRLRIYHSYPDKHHPDRESRPTNSSRNVEDNPNEAMGATAGPSIPAESFLWPGWNVETVDSEPPIAVTELNRGNYAKEYALWLTDYSIRPQFVAFAKGFNTVLDPKALKLLSPATLRSLVEGHKTLDITLLQRAATYRGYEAKSQLIKWFWEIVRSYPPDKQKQLLEFVTASSRVPVNGADSLTFVIEKVLGDTGQLPGSSTCFSTLRLPEYESLEKLRDKLDIALQHSLGFGQA